MPKTQRKNPYLEFVLERFAPVSDVSYRPMFGGFVLYSGGIPFALIGNNALFLKTDDHNRAEFEVRGPEAVSAIRR
jgi:TfoX/Sxy family transcriptional regulator of competence genes